MYTRNNSELLHNRNIGGAASTSSTLSLLGLFVIIIVDGNENICCSGVWSRAILTPHCHGPSENNLFANELLLLLCLPMPDIWIYVALERSYCCCCPKNEKPIESSTMDTLILIARPPAAPVLPIVILPGRPHDEYTAIAEHPCGNEWLPSSFMRTDCLPFDRVYA